MKKKIIIYGVGRFAEYAGYLFENDSPYEVAGYCIESSYLKKGISTSNNKKLSSFENLEETAPPEDHDLFIAVGNNLVRERIYTMAKQKGYQLATYISSRASSWDNLKIGDNSFIGEGSLVQPFTEIGNNCILFSTHIGHHSKIGDHCLLSATILGGNVQVGDFSYLGIHSSIRENLTIGPRNVIGMGAAISSNTKADAIFTAPAAIKRNITFQDLYRDHLDKFPKQ